MIQFRQSIGFRLLGISFILLALPLLVDSFVLFQKRYQHAISDAESILVEIAHLRELPLAQLQPLDKPMVDLLIYYLGLKSSFPEKPDEKLNEQLKALAEVGSYNNIYLLKITPDERYIVVASGAENLVGEDYTNFFKMNDIYSPGSLQRGYAVYISFNNKTLTPYFLIAHPIYSIKEKRYVGVLAITDNISSRVKKVISLDVRRYPVNFALLLPSTVVFAASDPGLKFQYFFPLKPEYKELLLKQEPSAAQALPPKALPVNNDIGFPFFDFTWRDEQQIGYIKKLPNANYSLLAYTSKNDIFETPLIHFFNIYSIYGLILILGGTVASLLTMRMAKPIQNLGRVMQKIQEGEVKLRYQKDPFGFEINVLGEIFNDMVDKVLEQKHVAEEERVARETLARELRLGQQVQRSLLPQTMPQYPGVEIAEMYIPAIEVGGDFYDVFIKEDVGEQKLVLAVADASGKGVQACFYSLSVRNILRTYARRYKDIAEAMVATNNLFATDTGDTGMFITVLGGVFDSKTKSLQYYSAGHNPGLVRRADGSIEILEYAGMAMGVVTAHNASPHKIQLNKGDTVVFYTDGITEAHNEEFKFFGEERLMECLKQEGFGSAAQTVERIVSAVSHFVGTAKQHDDITLLVMKIIE